MYKTKKGENSMGQAKRRGSYEDRVKEAKAKRKQQNGHTDKPYKVQDLGGAQIVTGDIEAYRKNAQDNLRAYFNRRWAEAKQGPINVDLAVLGAPKLWTGLEKTYYGHKLWPILYDVSIETNGKTLGESIARGKGNIPVLILQIWKGFTNMMIGISQARLDDAGFNWERKNLLADDDLLNRGISALRLMEDPMISTIIMDQFSHKRSKEQGVDAGKLVRIWD